MDYTRWVEALDKSFNLFIQRIAEHFPNILGSIQAGVCPTWLANKKPDY
jgi:hypothetical protein